MDSSLGARLRAHRERQQVTLSAISAETKIKLVLLEGLEHDDVSLWPEGIYRRAYVRAYARAIGLDPEELVREFLQVHPDPVVVAPPEETELETPHWPAEFRRLVNSALAVVPARRQRAEPVVLPQTAGGLGETAPRRERQVDPLPKPESRPESAATAAAQLDLALAAELCTRLGRASDARDVAGVLGDAATALDAVGVIVWTWDEGAAGLRPLFSCGYPDQLVARMPLVRPDDENGIAAAFRSAELCVVAGSQDATGAVIVPLLSSGRCVGVLAAEIRRAGEQREAVRALTAILATQFVRFVGAPSEERTVDVKPGMAATAK